MRADINVAHLSRLLPALAAITVLLLTGCDTSTQSQPLDQTLVRKVGPDADLSAGDANAWLDGILPTLLEREGVAGATISIVHQGNVITERGYGLSDTGISTGHQGLVSADTTLFRIGSVSKTITATAVMQLVQSGDLDLDQPIDDYLDFQLPRTFGTPITLRHLLTHTAGFEDQIKGVIGAPDEPVPSLRDIVSVDPPKQIFQPGTIPAYSNYSNALAGYIVQQVANQPYEDYVAEHIFSPAGMDTATMDQPLPPRADEKMSHGYESSSSLEVPFEMVGPTPAGAISATASDMSAFMLAQLGTTTDDDELLTAASLRQMHEPALDSSTLGGLAAGPRMTLGFFEQDRNGHRILEHSGDLTAFHAQLQIYPDDDTGIFLALNSSGKNADSSTAIREQVMNGFADRYYPDERGTTTPTATSGEHGRAVAGSYLVSRYSESTFARAFFLFSGVDITSASNGTLQISAITKSDGTPATFVEVEPWVWQEVDGQRRIAVDQDAGRVQAIGLNAAFTLLPMPPSATLLLPVALFSAGVVLLALLGRPFTVLIRWINRISANRDTRNKKLRLSLLFTQFAFVGCLVFWWLVAQPLLNDSLPPNGLVIRSAQLLTAIAVLGAAPASAIVLSTVRTPATEFDMSPVRKWTEFTGHSVVACAHLGLGYVAIIGGLFAPSISY